ncbi:hypothetical protein [Streptococcus sp. Marseille-Q5855]|uniref:hypothetical protein n=1 Tax=Streptococcus sp. Marseille-Q5855 TaxID=2972781 RepID=UPI0021C62C54|nr:hypothetical protein [Streptococcus sp. Marseille-Q5855]
MVLGTGHRLLDGNASSSSISRSLQWQSKIKKKHETSKIVHEMELKIAGVALEGSNG